MNEIFPILSGLVAGVVLGGFVPRVRWAMGTVTSIALGILATVVSGELALSWGFLLIDIALVALTSALGFMVSRAVRLRATGTVPAPQ